MVDVDTQDILDDIRSATQCGEKDKLFYLMVATPGGAPKRLHNDVIIPFLKCRGWQKVSYRNTGFRALYFLHDKDPVNANTEDPLETSVMCSRCKGLGDSNFKSPAKRPRKRKVSEPSDSVVPPTRCSNCISLTSTHRACQDRNDLKSFVDQYKQSLNGTFQIHIVLSQPVDYEEDFLEFASQPGAIEE